MLNKKMLGLVGAMALALGAAQPALANDRLGADSAVGGESLSSGGLNAAATGQDTSPRGRQQRQRDARRTPAPQQTPEQIREAAQVQLTATGSACQLTEATNPGLIAGAQVYEVACANTQGYILIASTPPQAFDCIELAATATIARERDPAADVGQQCQLPANQNSLQVISGWAREAGVACTIDQAMPIGKTGENIVYEIGCAGADGYWLKKTAAGWDLQDCIQIVSGNGACRFTTTQEQADGFEPKLAGTDAASCDVTRVHLMGTNPNGKFYEVKCAAEGEGYIARFGNAGAVQQIYPCATAQLIGGGCKLTPAPGAAPAAASGGRP